MATELITLKSAYAKLSGSVSTDTGVASISSLYVTGTDNYRKGYGTELFERFLSSCKGMKLISIEIFKHNDTAIKFWESKGFTFQNPLDQGFLEYTLTL